MGGYSLLDDERGPFLTLSPAEFEDVTSALTASGVAHAEDDGVGAGCAGPEVIVLRFPGSADRATLQAALDAALRPR